MTRIEVKRVIDAPISKVFQTVADIREFSKALPHVVDFEFLSDADSGVGTRFRETRDMKGKKMTTELEITEFVDDQCVRMVADSHGAVWDTLFQVNNESGQTELTMIMDAKPYQLMPKLMIPLTKGMIRKAVERDMDLVKNHCEAT